jgi:hypothetical protein
MTRVASDLQLHGVRPATCASRIRRRDCWLRRRDDSTFSPCPAPTAAVGGAAAGMSRKISNWFPISGLIRQVFNCVRTFL